MENTHNRAGGAVLPLAHMKEVYGLARENGVPVHLDGARLFNAAHALGRSREGHRAARRLGVLLRVQGTVRAGRLGALRQPATFIERARAYRRMVGGNMRQAGPLAAAGIVALETMVNRLPEDHQTAKRLAEGFHRIDASLCDPAGRGNQPRARGREEERQARRAMVGGPEGEGSGVAPADIWTLRFVTHRHISAQDADAAVAAFAGLWRRA